MNCYSTIHALELIYFDSNTQKNDEKPVISFRFFQLSATAPKKSRQSFDCNASVYMYFLRFLMRKNDVTPSNVKETWSMGRMTS